MAVLKLRAANSSRQASGQSSNKQQASGLSKRKPTIKQMSKQAECVAAKDF
jgi:hypothetical protein